MKDNILDAIEKPVIIKNYKRSLFLFVCSLIMVSATIPIGLYYDYVSPIPTLFKLMFLVVSAGLLIYIFSLIFLCFSFLKKEKDSSSRKILVLINLGLIFSFFLFGLLYRINVL